MDLDGIIDIESELMKDQSDDFLFRYNGISLSKHFFVVLSIFGMEFEFVFSLNTKIRI